MMQNNRKTDSNKNLFTHKVTHKIFTHNLESLTQSCQGLYEIAFDNLSFLLLWLRGWKGNEKLPTHYFCGVHTFTKQLRQST